MGWDGAAVMDDHEKLHYSREDWTDVSRDTEYQAFGLVLGVFVTSLQKLIHWQREVERRQAERARRDRYEYVALVFKLFRYYSQPPYDGMTHQGRCILVAMKMTTTKRAVSAEQVQQALLEAEEMALGESV
jgi:hypothetical protein